MSKANKVTIKTVAADAEVSVTAVSNVLRNAYGVSDAMRDKVLKSIEKLGYRPSTTARGMRGQTYTVGVLLMDILNPFVSELVGGIQQTFEASNYKLMFGVGRGERQIESNLIETMIDNRMDGIILVAPHLELDRLDHLAREVPIVLIGHHEPNSQNFDTVNVDDVEGARIATHALYDAGHRNIRMLTLPNNNIAEFDVSFQREVGYKRAMQELGLGDAINVVTCDLRPKTLEGADQPLPETMRTLLHSCDKPVAYFCWSDLHAIHLLDQARAMGLRVPDDVAVIGFDNTPNAALHSVDLASIDQGASDLGRHAARLVLERVSGRSSPQHFLNSPRLVRRASF